MAYIYIITNMINGKMYIGQTINKVENRIKKHRNNSKNKCPKLHNSIQKYGWQNFTTTYHNLGDCSREELDDCEVSIIQEHREAGIELLNLTDGGGGNKGWKPSQEIKNKISKSLIGKTKGRKKPPFTEEHRRHMSEVRKGKTTWNKGILRTEIEKDKIRNTLKNNKNNTLRLQNYNKVKSISIILTLPSGEEENFESIRSACRKYNLDIGCISKICQGKQKQTKGYKANYAN